jgi:hypothetical protein
MSEMARILPKRELEIGPRTSEFLYAVNATGDPGRDNQAVEAFLAAETDPFRLAELKKDREQLPAESPWQIPHIEEFVIDLIRLCHWHYLETENPLFVFRAIVFAQHLTTANDHYVDWVRKYLIEAAGALANLVARPPAAEESEAAFATALKLGRDKYKNPIREAALVIEADDLYSVVRRLVGMGLKTTEVMQFLADDLGISYQKIRAIYYQRRKLAQTEATQFNASTLISLISPSF